MTLLDAHALALIVAGMHRPGTTRNRGVCDANATVFLPLDADNRLHPGFVEAARDVLAHNRLVTAA
jgi:hypothetical protein